MHDTEDLLPVFLLELQEQLDNYEHVLLQLEKESQPGTLQELFRLLHTLKGTTSLFGYKRMSRVIHQGESVANALRTERLVPHPAVVSALFELGDYLRQALIKLQQTGVDPQIDDTDLMLTLAALHVEPSQNTSTQLASSESPLLSNSLAQGVSKSEPSPREWGRSSLEESLLSVQVEILNQLLERSSELMILRHAFGTIHSYLPAEQQRTFQWARLRYQSLASDLHSVLSQVRMQAIGRLWKHYPRLIRELEQSSGKKLQLDAHGSDLEMDKAVLESIRDPLIHLLRNAVDHGIEAPHLRLQQGKSEIGRLTLKAYQEQGQIFVELEDDGQGLNFDKIRQQAIQQNLISAETKIDENTLIQLIFEPGFSTASQISEISGRGVGLDIVQTHLEAIGGNIQVLSQAGKGTRFCLQLPLTIGVLPGLLFKNDHLFFVLPQYAVQEVILGQNFALSDLGEMVYGRLRGQLLPYSRLSLHSRDQSPSPFVLILKGQQRFALGVDQVEELREVMIKPLSEHWQAVPMLGGVTLLGEGHLALILSLRELEHSICREQVFEHSDNAEQHLPEEPEQAYFLLFRDRSHALLALPLANITHLETVFPHEIGHVPGYHLIKRDNQLIPVVDLATQLQQQNQALILEDSALLIRCQQDQSEIALVVHEILDLIPTDCARGPSQRIGTTGTLESSEGIAELLDLDYLSAQLRVNI